MMADVGHNLEWLFGVPLGYGRWVPRSTPSFGFLFFLAKRSTPTLPHVCMSLHISWSAPHKCVVKKEIGTSFYHVPGALNNSFQNLGAWGPTGRLGTNTSFLTNRIGDGQSFFFFMSAKMEGLLGRHILYSVIFAREYWPASPHHHFVGDPIPHMSWLNLRSNMWMASGICLAL